MTSFTETPRATLPPNLNPHRKIMKNLKTTP